MWRRRKTVDVVSVPPGVIYEDAGIMDYGRYRIYRDETGLQVVLPDTLVKFIQEQRSEHARG